MRTKDIKVEVGEVYVSRKMKMEATVTRMNPSRTQVAFMWDGCECVLTKSEFLKRHDLKVAA